MRNAHGTITPPRPLLLVARLDIDFARRSSALCH